MGPARIRIESVKGFPAAIEEGLDLQVSGRPHSTKGDDIDMVPEREEGSTKLAVQLLLEALPPSVTPS